MARAIDILTMGEPLMEFSEQERDGVRVYLPGHGGDTSNCAVAAARQGAKAACFTAVGDDAFGRSFLALWDAERRRPLPGAGPPRRPPGLLHQLRPGRARVQLLPRRVGREPRHRGRVPADLVASARILHASGISQAISLSACDAVFRDPPRQAGRRLVSYDTNLRLVAAGPRPRGHPRSTVALADIVRPGLDDARQLTGRETPDAILTWVSVSRSWR